MDIFIGFVTAAGILLLCVGLGLAVMQLVAWVLGGGKD